MKKNIIENWILTDLLTLNQKYLLKKILDLTPLTSIELESITIDIITDDTNKQYKALYCSQ